MLCTAVELSVSLCSNSVCPLVFVLDCTVSVFYFLCVVYCIESSSIGTGRE